MAEIFPVLLLIGDDESAFALELPGAETQNIWRQPDPLPVQFI